MLKKRLQSGDFLLGTHVQAQDASLTELMGLCGFDYVWIDTEHTAIDYKTLQVHLMAASAAHCPAIVRVPQAEAYLVKRVLDQGADGIVFPNINTAEEAKKAMDFTFYPPRGIRGYGPIRAGRYGLRSVRECLEYAENHVCRFIQVEHISSVLRLEEILEVPGIDGIILGPCDLAGSLGNLEETETFEMENLIGDAIRICGKKKMPAGISLGTANAGDIIRWKNRGLQMISACSEYGFILNGAHGLTDAVREAAKGNGECS